MIFSVKTDIHIYISTSVKKKKTEKYSLSPVHHKMWSTPVHFGDLGSWMVEEEWWKGRDYEIPVRSLMGIGGWMGRVRESIIKPQLQTTLVTLH